MQNRIPVDTTRTLGAVIRTVRIAADLTQADAAALCGVSAPFLNGLERGKPTAQVGLILAVCQGLGISLAATTPIPVDLSNAPRRKPGRRPR
jgi:transcriptional regulator with XRE-family HTH domain